MRIVRTMMRRGLTGPMATLPAASGLLLVAYASLAVGAAHHQLLPVDARVRDWVQPMRSGVFEGPMAVISFLGEPAGLVPLILVTSALLWRASRRWAVLLPALMAGTGALQLLGKWAADRPRPNAAPWGFPSGHVLSLAVFFGVLAFLLVTVAQGPRRWRRLGCAGCGLTVGLVAVSRVYLDMHWLSDIIGGFSLGTAYLLLAIWATQVVFARPTPPPAPDESPRLRPIPGA